MANLFLTGQSTISAQVQQRINALRTERDGETSGDLVSFALRKEAAMGQVRQRPDYVACLNDLHLYL